MNQVIKVPYWWWDGALEPELCDAIVSIGNRLELSAAGIKNEREIDKDYRTTQVGFFSSGHWVQSITDKFVKEANRGAEWNFDLDSSELVQYGKYAKGCFYKEHRDCDVEKYENRKLSISVQLTNEERYNGGNFKLKDYYGQELILPEGLRNQGSIIVFPSMLLHEVTEVRAGTRHSLVQWHSGPEFK